MFKSQSAAWNVFKYGFFSGPYFPAFGPETKKNSVVGHFSRSGPYQKYLFHTSRAPYHPAITCSKLTIETVEQGMNYVQT